MKLFLGKDLKGFKKTLIPETGLRRTAVNALKQSFKVVKRSFNAIEQSFYSTSGLQQRRLYYRFKKNYFAEKPINLERVESFRAENFPPSGPYPWLDLPDASEQIAARLKSGHLSEEQAQYCHQWVDNGVIVLRNLLTPDFLNQVWAAYEASIETQIVPLKPEKICDEDPHPGRYLDPHFLVPELNELLYYPEIVKWVELLLGRKPTPFQTITSHKGSQQMAHSDSIHMTTYPLGYLAAAWIAFEDIHPDSGPLIYYPGSHKLPYLFSKDVGLAVGEWTKDVRAYGIKYELAIARLIQEKNLTPTVFDAKKGDVLFWHANLLHGGSTRKNVRLSRRSVVCHYFAEGAVCYHDLSGQRSRMDKSV